MRLYGSVGEVVTMFLVYNIWRLLALVLISPTPSPKKNPGFGFFVKIYLLDEAILMSTRNIPFPYMKKKIILNYPKSAAMGFFPRDPRTSSKQPW